MGRLADQMRRDFQRFQQQADKNAVDAATFLQTETRRTLSTKYPPASRPGQAPRYRTGRLHDNQFARLGERGTIRLTNATKYAKYLRPTRPWEGITLDRVGPQLEAILHRSLKGALNGRP